MSANLFKRGILLFSNLLALAFLDGLLVEAQPVAYPTNGLIAYYSFNGDAKDLSGIGNDGFTRNVTYTTNRFGLAGAALKCNGVSTSVIITNFSGVNFNTFPLTVSAWVRFDSSVDADVAIVSKYYQSSGNGWTLDGRSASFRSWFYGQFGDVQTPDALGLRTKSIELGKWVQAICVYDSTGGRLFLDGTIATNRGWNGTPSLPTSAQPIMIGMGIYESGADPRYFNGAIDDVRIYNRALTDSEAKALYTYESKQSIHGATASAQVVNGFVVGITVFDGGFGYTNVPSVRIVGAGTNAQVTATLSGGVVTGISITDPGRNYGTNTTVSIDPPPFPPRRAKGTATVINGFVTGVTITDGGYGYTIPPAIVITGMGFGAEAMAIVTNGTVTGFTITNPGSGYTIPPVVTIASPPFAPSVSIATSKVKVTQSVVLGLKYQLESSTNLNTWTSVGNSFVASDEIMVVELDVDAVGKYFRIQQVP